MSCIIEELAEQILDVCGSESEVTALIDNILCYIRELNLEQQEENKLNIESDDKDDKEVEFGETEELEVITDAEGFMSLR